MSQEDEKHRENIFLENLRTISRHNFKFRHGKTTFELGINQFADWTFKEFSEMFTPNDTMKEQAAQQRPTLTESFEPEVMYGLENDDDDEELPESFDWRALGAVTSVKNQGKCGSCYAMATVGSIESSFFIRTGKLVELSEQEIVDCAGDYQTFGCDGGHIFTVFEFVKAKGGLSTMADYPYTGEVGECQNTNRDEIPIKGYGIVLYHNDEKVLMKALTKLGPIVVMFDINHESFMRYSSGIYFEEDCTIDVVNHAALLVGFGVKSGREFWIVKNSFGVKWGDDGYVRMARNRGNGCGILKAPIFPILKATN